MKSPFRFYIMLITALWTVIIACFLIWNIYQEKRGTEEEAYIQANVSYEKDILYRKWSAMHGGVYVPITPETPPNPYLSHIPERDITTPSGKKLTLINPAYMSRQVYESEKKKYGVIGRLTSLKPIRPENAPDKWEENTLRLLEQGKDKVSSIEKTDDTEYFRLMRPLITQKSCLKCHESQGYKEGDIRGGISIAIPMEPFQNIMAAHVHIFFITHILIWLSGLLAIFFAAQRLNKSESERRQAEEAIRRAKEDWEQTFDAIPDLIAILNNEQQILRCNKTMAQWMECDTHELLGKKCYECFHHTREIPPFCPFIPMMKDKKTHSEEEYLENWDKYFLVSVTPIYDNYGNIKSCVHVARDITGRKQAENLQMGVNRVLEAVITGDDLGTVLEMLTKIIEEQNPDMLCSILLMSEDRKHLLHGAAPGLPDAYNQAVNGIEIGPMSGSCGTAAFLKKTVITEDIGSDPKWENFRSLAMTHHLRSCWSHPIFSYDNKVLGTIAVYACHPRYPTDKELYLMEAAARIAGIAIERRNSEKKLLNAKHAAESANRAKSEFLAQMSHELRTPLNGILGYAQILMRDGSLTQKHQDAVSVMYKSGEHLLTIINDILDISKIEAKKMALELSDFCLAEVSEEIAEITRVKCIEKNIAFDYENRVEIPIIVRGDEKRLRQVLLNLLGNAVKYTQKGSVIFRVSGGRKQEEIRFEVEDTGIGIPEDRQEEIFLPFHQVADRRLHVEGTGLGLAISRRLVWLMGGELNMKSVVGKGSLFRFEIKLPCVGRHQITEQQSDTRKPVIGYEGARIRVLIADDVGDSRNILKDLLSPLGFEIAEAGDGEEALHKLSEFNPKLVLTDLIMPKMNGTELIKNIRNGRFSDEPIIIVISASVMISIKIQCFQNGCDDFISKPVDADELLDKIQIHLGLKWIYGTADISSGTVKPSAKAVIPPSDEYLEILWQMAEIGDIIGIRQHLKKLADENADLVPFSETLDDYAKKFQTKMIRQFISQYRPI